MAYNQSEMRMMGRIVAQVNKKPIKEVYDDYRSHLLKALFRSPKAPSMINVFMHALGYFSTRLHTNEKAFFLDSLEKYRAGRSTFTTHLQLLRSWVIRFDEPHLKNQRFFEPYPEVLMELVDSGKGRE